MQSTDGNIEISTGELPPINKFQIFSEIFGTLNIPLAVYVLEGDRIELKQSNKAFDDFCTKIVKNERVGDGEFSDILLDIIKNPQTLYPVKLNFNTRYEIIIYNNGYFIVQIDELWDSVKRHNLKTAFTVVLMRLSEFHDYYDRYDDTEKKMSLKSFIQRLNEILELIFPTSEV